MKMSLPSSLAKSARYGETKVGPSGEAFQEESLKTRRTKTKAPECAIRAKNLNTSSRNVQIKRKVKIRRNSLRPKKRRGL